MGKFCEAQIFARTLQFSCHTIHPAQTPIIVIPFDLIRVNLLNKMNEINYNFCVGNRQTFMDHQLGCGEWNGINVA